MSSQPDWKDIGRSFSHAMKNAMNTLDFSELNQSIEMGGDGLRPVRREI